MSRIVEGFSASKWLGTDRRQAEARHGGLSRAEAEVTFLFFRLVSPASASSLALVYVVAFGSPDLAIGFKGAICSAGAYRGHQGAGDLPVEHHLQAAEDRSPGLSRHARSAS